MFTCTTADCIATVTLFDEAGQRPFTICATEGHPFWVWGTGGDMLALADTGANERRDGLKYRHDAHGNLVRDSQGWVFATDLRGGYELPSFTSVWVLGVERTPVRRVPVYNFGVAGTRTYFVGDLGLAAPVPVWVHNQCKDKIPEGGADKTPGRAVRNPADDKKLSNGEIKKLLDNQIDPHDLKPNSKYDLFKDKDGNIWVKPKDGSGPGDETGININDYR